MILYLNGSVNKKMTEKLLDAINSLRKEDNLHIYFTSGGGSTYETEVIIDVINKNKEFIGITFYGEVYSAGMEIMLRLECAKFILKDTRAMYHYSYDSISISEGGKPSTLSDEFAVQEMKKVKKRTLEFLKERGFTQKEISVVRRGSDLYIAEDRIRELINGTTR